MKGYAIEGVNQASWRDGLPQPEARYGEVVVKPVVVAPCTSDVHILETMAFPTMKGKPMGHEMAGIVHEVGPGVRDFKVGDRVAVPSLTVDWGDPQFQDGYDKYASVSPYFSEDPRLLGCFAEYFLVMGADLNLAHIPDAVTWEQAVVLTDMGTTAFEGVHWLDLDYGQSVVVYGIGAVGLMAVRAAYLKGAGRLFAIGSREVSFEIAREFGASDLVNYRDGDVAEQVLARNGGPVDAVVVCGGSDISAIADAMKMVRFGGHVTNVAVFMHDKQFVLPNELWAFGSQDKTLRSVSCRGGRANLERLLKLAEYGRVAPERLATHTYHGMEHIEKALAQMGGHDRTAIKPVVFFD
ncbi:MAG: alcohol dehydrogenase catalytic domain-containing protein [Propionibacteriaceae bacterium]|jgi:threonine dehydrogenase-like Zn-dependent dehydrogenase|nr:alcohol dehydrogenase catalytic domain-containing protein [Propionibacteriaceae bacterium]